MTDNLTFEDGVLLCKYIYQSVIDKTLNGVIEKEQIFYKAHELLNKLNHNFNNERLDELLHTLNMENVYTIISKYFKIIDRLKPVLSCRDLLSFLYYHFKSFVYKLSFFFCWRPAKTVFIFDEIWSIWIKSCHKV